MIQNGVIGAIIGSFFGRTTSPRGTSASRTHEHNMDPWHLQTGSTVLKSALVDEIPCRIRCIICVNS